MSFTRAGNVIQKIVDNIAGSKYKDLFVVSRAWPEVVGELIANRTFLQKIDKGTLYIMVENSIWMQELVLRKWSIINQLKKEYGLDIENIIFMCKDLDYRPPMRKKRRKR
jgi:predicted nucleic acid-binding Zn ribbon protein